MVSFTLRLPLSPGKKVLCPLGKTKIFSDVEEKNTNNNNNNRKTTSTALARIFKSLSSG
jgi:hypothetical protein